jgi:predicted AlkP superfamily phosphohydrolase/phosphomutase
MISGMDTPAAESDFIYPSSVRAELEENVGGYLLEKVERDVRDRKTDVFIKNLRDATRNRLEVADYLIQKEDWDLFILVFESGDRAQHQLWKHMDTAHPLYRKKSGTRYGNVIRDVYEDMDARLGELLARIPGNVTTVVLSDHGFGPVYKGVRLNKWLGLNGYLSARHPDRHSANLMMIDQVRRFMPESVKKALKRLVAPERRRKPTLRALDNLEMTGTTVYALGGNGNLYINLKGRQPGGVVEPGQEYEKLREEVIEKMRALKDPEDGRPVVEAVHKREEVYPVYEEHAPDILISWAHGYSFAGERELVAGEKAYDAEGVFVTHKWSGNHRPDGILLLQGDRIRQGCKLSGAQVVDIAPTILALMSTPVPDDMDGKILIEALTEEFVNSGAVTYQEGAQTTEEDSGKKGYTDDEAERVRERLRNLGYIE